MKVAFFAVVLVLGGCTTMTDVIPLGEGRYTVGTASRGGTKTDVEVKAGALKRANEYCAEKGKQMVLLNTTSSGVQGWTVQNAEVNFRCD